MIDPDFWTDENVQDLPSLGAVLLYIGCISHADDEGRFEWSSRQLWARVFPARTDVTLSDVERWMIEILSARLIRVFTVGGRDYALHPNWKKHQYVNKPSPSKIPCPPRGGSRNGSGSDYLIRPVPLESESVMESESEYSVGTAVPTASEHRPIPTEIPNPPDGFPIDWPANPDDIGAMIELAKPFQAQFGNCKSPDAQAKYRREYTTTLAAFRGRGHRTLVAWECFAKAWIANSGKPLFGKLCGGALDFAPRRSAAR